MNVGVIIPEVGDYSPLALEFEKWHEVMIQLGHNVSIFTGRMSRFSNNVTVMSDLCSDNDTNVNIYHKLYSISNDDTDIVELLEETSNRIVSVMKNWITIHDIDILIVENYLSIPINLAVSYALFKLFKEVNCVKLVKHHDAFYRKNLNSLTQNEFVQKVLLSCFPVTGENIFHISTNRLIKSYLKEHCNVDSIVIPYVVNFSDTFSMPTNGYPKLLNDQFQISKDDKLLINFSYLTPNSFVEKMIHLISSINDQHFKIIVIGKIFKEFEDYIDYVSDTVLQKGISDRILILPESSFICSKDREMKLDLHSIFSYAKGVISLDYGVSFGQPLLFGIQHKCPLLFCPKSRLQWLEMDDLGCKSVDISSDLNDFDIELINRYINQDLNWGEFNYSLFKQYYSMKLLQYLIGNMLTVK